MNLNHVLTFIRIAEERSFSAAAKRLKRPRSQVSRDLRTLEETLGVRLLDRTTRQVQLTESGHLYFQRCKNLLDELEDATHALQGMQDEFKGVIRVTAPVDLGAVVISGLVAEFLKAYPQLKVELNCTQRVVNLIEEQFDLAIRAVQSLSDSSFIARPLGTIPVELYASPDWVEKHPGLTHPEQLNGLGVVVFQPRNEPPEWEIMHQQEQVTLRPQGQLTTDDLSGALQGILQGLGYGVLPYFMARPHVEAGQLIRLFPEWQGPFGSVYAVYPSRRLLQPKVKVLLDFLQEHFQEKTRNGIKPSTLEPGGSWSAGTPD